MFENPALQKPKNVCGENVEWIYDKIELKLKISGTGPMSDFSSQRPPPWFQNMSIAETLKAVEISTGVTTIGSYSFSSCLDLESISFSLNITKIGENAFSNCPSLKIIKTSSSNKNYKTLDNVLYSKDGTCLIFYPPNRKGRTFEIPPEVKTICSRSFCSCQNLRTITISTNVTTIEDDAFSNCQRLTSFKVEEDNPQFKVVDNIIFTKDDHDLVRYPPGLHHENYSVPLNVARICPFAFADCKRLKTLEIGNNVMTIDAYAISSATNINKITIGASVSSISPKAFTTFSESEMDHLSYLTQFEVDERNARFRSVDGVLFNKKCDIILRYPPKKAGTVYSIPYCIAKVASYAFADCRLLRIVEIGEKVETIEKDAFFNSSLQAIKVNPNNENYASYEYALFSKNMEELIRFPKRCSTINFVIPTGVQSITENAFYGCNNLKSVSIPLTVTQIGSKAFSHCYHMSTVTYGRKDIYRDLSLM